MSGDAVTAESAAGETVASELRVVRPWRVRALVRWMRGLTETSGEVAPGTWQRFLDIHLAGLRTPGPLSATPSMSAGQLAELLPRP